LGAKLRISEDKTKNINIFIGLIIEPGDFNLKGSCKLSAEPKCTEKRGRR